MSKTNNVIKVNRSFRIIREFSKSTILNGYFGGSSLVGHHLNDWRTESINEYIGKWLDDNHNKKWNDTDISAYELIDNPDHLIQRASNEFCTAFSHVFNSGRDCESEFKNAVYLLDQCSDNYFVFAEQWSNACCSIYIIQEMNISAAHDVLTEYYMDKFSDDDRETESSLMDNVQYIGSIEIE